MTHDPATRTPGAFQRRLADLVGRRSVWAAIIVVVVALPLLRAFTAEAPLAPPPLFPEPLPEFRLVDERGRPFGSAELRGKTWVANFVFTRCTKVCPELTKSMAQVAYRIRNVKSAAHLVSITVDPTYDTPKQLFAYADAHHALESGDWTFLTGKLDDLRALVFGGFRMPFGSGDEDEERAPGAPRDPAAELIDVAHLTHGRRLVLVDPDLRIRGYYEPDREGLDRLVHDVGLVVNQVPAAPQSEILPKKTQ